MICNHLKELFQYCKEHDVRLSSSDLVHIVCKQCGIQEVCPSALVEELDVAPSLERPAPAPSQPAPSQSSATPAPETLPNRIL